ncbi:MAG: hypothetical protein LBI99_06010 [Propionibacteriaceae bacterium]|nr:hypothetical protein [Propionibacteriaceae bacterium]
MSGNPFVHGSVDTSTPLSGTLLLEDGQLLADALVSGDWIAGGMATFSTALDTFAMATDPIGTLFAMGFGWLLEHIQPLKGWLNELTGDPGQVAEFSQTWTAISDWLTGLADDLAQLVQTDLADMTGDTIDAYTAWQQDLAALIVATGTWSNAMSVAMGLATTLVQIVHDIVRDAIAQVAGAICSYILELIFTAGLATPLVIEQAATRGASIAGRVTKSITRLIDSTTALAKHSDELANLLTTASRKLADGKPRSLGQVSTTPVAAKPIPALKTESLTGQHIPDQGDAFIDKMAQRLNGGYRWGRAPTDSFDVVAHGTPTSVIGRGGRELSASELATDIRKNPAWNHQSVHIVACDCGSGSFLQELSDSLGVKVKGYDIPVIVNSRGKVVPARVLENKGIESITDHVIEVFPR